MNKLRTIHNTLSQKVLQRLVFRGIALFKYPVDDGRSKQNSNDDIPSVHIDNTSQSQADQQDDKRDIICFLFNIHF